MPTLNEWRCLQTEADRRCSNGPPLLQHTNRLCSIAGQSKDEIIQFLQSTEAVKANIRKLKLLKDCIEELHPAIVHSAATPQQTRLDVADCRAQISSTLQQLTNTLADQNKAFADFQRAQPNAPNAVVRMRGGVTVSLNAIAGSHMLDWQRKNAALRSQLQQKIDEKQALAPDSQQQQQEAALFEKSKTLEIAEINNIIAETNSLFKANAFLLDKQQQDKWQNIAKQLSDAYAPQMEAPPAASQSASDQSANDQRFAVDQEVQAPLAVGSQSRLFRILKMCAFVLASLIGLALLCLGVVWLLYVLESGN